ncbi:helix-turn-helix transcriptional regulator [Bacillus cereus]|uniref:helix-turn-helix transcriptional regulator n=1 Tax=Bacillus cereus group TaxID=86661 RepID=UPI0018F4D170|nr:MULTISPECIES: helix-turn-helix transcriptional regulator [Bacillus cereus group]MBJ8154333.1 helix-turn-helix transcriptional regulator [Bacillus cereus]MBJ8205028.1 helix-turn-helix transcriptional regulator [Bacillus cereus]
MSHLNKRLAELRKKQGYTQSDISHRLNIARTTYANWEYGKADPDADSIMRIAELHNITIDELFGRNNPLERKLESIKVALADLPADKQQEALDVLIDYTYFIKKHFSK